MKKELLVLILIACALAWAESAPAGQASTLSRTAPWLFNLFIDPKEELPVGHRMNAWLASLAAEMGAHAATFKKYPPKKISLYVRRRNEHAHPQQKNGRLAVDDETLRDRGSGDARHRGAAERRPCSRLAR
jgi:hypothetical protein